MQAKLLLISLLFACNFSISYAQKPVDKAYPKRQFRGVWIATVRNLDWPSDPNLSWRKKKEEFINQLDQLEELGMNAVIVQIRPTADAFYPSNLEPWSEFLTGRQGKAPPANFDPLAFMIEEAHKRCMEFHAWFNPYRGFGNFQKGAQLARRHIYFQHRDWFVQYGPDLYFDPGMVPARKFVEKVVADVVSRYDIDAVHFDDYYYPYRIKGEEFPDSTSFALYPGGFEADQKEDWRRENINLLVRELFDTINQIKPWVHFGISPFGVWRNKSQDPKGSDTNTSQTNYDDLYGDALAWMQHGWLDYIVPQSYEHLGRPIMDYRIVAQWWNDNHYDVNYYIGQSPFRLGKSNRSEQWTQGNEIVRQLHFNDSIPDLRGSAYFRSQTFMENPKGINDSLKNNFYKFPALSPVSHHDADEACLLTVCKAEYKIKGKKLHLKWRSDNPKKARYYVIYKSENINDPQNIIGITKDLELKLELEDLGTPPFNLYLTAVDKYRIESEAFQLAIPPN